MTTAEVLEAAADLIDEKGWWDGSPVNKRTGKHCALTAVSKVSVDDDLQYTAALDALEGHLGIAGSAAIPDWNDSQTKESVVRTLREVAAKLTTPIIDRDTADEDPNWETRQYEPVANVIGPCEELSG